MAQVLFGERLKYLRDQSGMSQDELADLLGLESRQIVSNIENSVRKMSGTELVASTEIFGVSLDFFTNPYLLVGQGSFSWRQTGVDIEELRSFEILSGEWLGAYRSLRDKLGIKPRALLAEVRLTTKSSYEDAVEMGEAVAAELRLGDIPAFSLASAAEKLLDAVILMADAQEGISGAACRLPEMNAIIINRKEPLSRRSFDLAHEIFHILTWEAMPPEYLDGTDRRKSRIEQLADKFASGLLLPRYALEKHLESLQPSNQGFVDSVNQVATELMVSSVALLWRLVDLGILGRDQCKEYQETDWFTYNGGLMDDSCPPLLSKKYLSVISEAVQKGLISERKVSSLLRLSFEELEELFVAHNLDSPLGL
jgi:Zn-dependent peptidase ImmA (M78 family)